MKKFFIKGFCLILIAIFACGFLNGCVHAEYRSGSVKAKYPIYIKTKAVCNTELSFFEFTDHNHFSRCDEFEPTINEYYITENFYLYDNTMEDAFKEMGDNFFNAKLEKVPIPEKVRKALVAVDNFKGRKNHWIWVERVFVCGERCYLSIAYNVNLQTPYSLLEYDEKSDTLTELLYLSNEQIIGIKR